MNYNNYRANDETTNNNIKTNKKALSGYSETIKFIKFFGRLNGNVLDVGSRNYVTEKLEIFFNINIDSTEGDLDTDFTFPDKKYDFIHYNNVIEHQFNPLYTLLTLKRALTDIGIIILATPLKPKWITTSKCHFHEFDKYTYSELLKRAGLVKIKETHFYYQIRFRGIRLILGSFYKRQVITALVNKENLDMMDIIYE